MRKYLSYIIFAGVVLLVGGIAVTRSRAIKTLVDGMKSSDRQLQAASAGTLIKDEQFMDSISGDTTETRVKAAEALEVLGSKGAITQLFNLLKDQEKVVRERAILALKHVGATTPENVTTFADGLKDGDGNVRKGVLRAMSEGADAIGPKPGIIPAICIAMQKEGNARGPGGDILSSKVFLAAKSEIESIPLLVALLKDKDEGVRTGEIGRAHV